MLHLQNFLLTRTIIFFIALITTYIKVVAYSFAYFSDKKVKTHASKSKITKIVNRLIPYNTRFDELTDQSTIFENP